MANTSKKTEKEFSAFIGDIVEVMGKHKVDHLLAVFSMNGYIRNSYLTMKEEDDFYCKLSDGINAFMKQGVNN